MASNRPPGISSRVRRSRGPRQYWTASNGALVELPVIVDILEKDSITGSIVWKAEATIDLVDGHPALMAMHLVSTQPVDIELVQREFRWATPLEIVTITIPELVHAGIDPFRYHYPRTGYPEAASVERSAPTRLTDEFLTDIATRYVLLGRGYAKTIAAQRNVTPRTVVSWIEKARQRGILSPTTSGATGGHVTRSASTRPGSS